MWKKATKLYFDDVTKFSTFYSKSKTETVINEGDIVDACEPIYSPLISNIQKSLGLLIKYPVTLLVFRNTID